MRKDDALKAQIIRAGIAIGAIQVAPGMDQLFAGPNGQVPILNDTRLHISYPGDRKMILAALKKLVTPEMTFDAIVGTTTAGIAWAALLAQELQKPLILMHNMHVYQINIPADSAPDEVRAIEAHDIVAAGGPFAIPQAAVLAHAFDKGMIYLRSTPSAFGKPIEGAFASGQNVLLVRNHPLSQKTEYYEKELAYNELSFTKRKGTTEFVPDVSIEGKKLLVIEDLLSGGKSLDEIISYRHHGAEIEKILCIFDQSKSVTVSKLKEEKLPVASIATYEDILNVAIEDGHMAKHLKPQYLLWPTDTHWVTKAKNMNKRVNETVES